MRYSPAVLDRLRAPRRAGALEGAEGTTGTGDGGSLDNGTLIRVQVRLVAGRVAEGRFRAFGCGAAIASASFVAEHVEGLTVDEARALETAAVVSALELPEERVHVAALAVQAVRAAIDDGVRRMGDADD
jgi:nitrogen fixation NifU-like protein